MIRFKSCPRCRGDVHHDIDEFGPFTSCLECGYYLKQQEEVALGISARPSLFQQPMSVETEKLAA